MLSHFNIVHPKEKKLREAFLYHYKILCNHNFTIDNVVVTPANAAISQVINSITDVGDAMLLPILDFQRLACLHNTLKSKKFYMNWIKKKVIN